MTAPAGGNAGGAGPPHPDDLLVLATIARGSAWLRAVTCTLARRGVAFRLAHGERARALLDALESSPLYKMGQFLFDLTEWEDFMIEMPPPPVVPTVLDARALARIATLLHELQAHVDGSRSDGAGPGAVGARPASPTGAIQLDALPTGAAPETELPPLEAGFYLYQDVVLGALQSAMPALRARERASGG